MSQPANRLLGVTLFAVLASCASFVGTSPKVSADAICTIVGNPTPPPQGKFAITIPQCDTTGHLMVTSSAVATPIPGPTDTNGVPFVHPTSVPTTPVSLPGTFQTAFPTPPPSIPVFRNSTGPVLGTSCDQSMPVNSTTSGTNTVSLVPITFGLTTYICGYYLSVSGSSSSTLTFEYGVHISAPCDTGPSALSGPIVLLTGQVYEFGDGAHTVFQPGATKELCMVVTGTGTSIQGFVTYAKY